MATLVHLVVDQGPDRGLSLSIPPGGARLGRASRNDFVLQDLLLSRHHCRFFFKPHKGLCVADLGSANETLVNGKAVTEAQLHNGDTVALGKSVLRVVSDKQPKGVHREDASPPGIPSIDLGLRKPASHQGRKLAKSPPPLLVIVSVVTVAAIAVWLPRVGDREAPKTIPAPVSETTFTLEVEYEKVEADSDGIFRYELTIAQDKRIIIVIDNTDKVHVREQGDVRDDLIQDLARFIDNSGFFTLEDEYRGMGIQPNMLEQRLLSVTINKNTHECRVINHPEPDIFASVRERLEQFGHVELGLWAIQYPPEELIEMAQDAFLLGRKLYDEREIKYGNLFAAIRSFSDSRFFLKTVDPKPDFYADILTSLTDCREELQKRYIDQNFRAEHAINSKDWEVAANELKILCELIPDRSDERHKEARTRLLEVENRLRSDK